MKATYIVATCLLLICLAGCNLPAYRHAAPFPELPTVAPDQASAPLLVADDFLTDAKVVSYDPLDSMRNWNFQDETGTLTNGVFQLRGTARWQSSLWPKQSFTEGEGLIIKFKVEKANAQSEFVFVTGDWRKDNFRQFGIYNAVIPKGDLFQASMDRGGYALSGNLTLQSETWYELLLAIGPHGHFLAVLWDPSNEAERVVHDVAGGADWAGRGWIFLPKANTGETIYLDEFYRIELGDIK